MYPLRLPRAESSSGQSLFKIVAPHSSYYLLDILKFYDFYDIYGRHVRYDNYSNIYNLDACILVVAITHMMGDPARSEELAAPPPYFHICG
eukprot:8718155-Karenia_brevis.AAC.1